LLLDELELEPPPFEELPPLGGAGVVVGVVSTGVVCVGV